MGGNTTVTEISDTLLLFSLPFFQDKAFYTFYRGFDFVITQQFVFRLTFSFIWLNSPMGEKTNSGVPSTDDYHFFIVCFLYEKKGKSW